MKFKIIFTENQWKKVSDISSGFGLLTMGAITIPAILDKTNIFHVALGLLVTIISWYVSLFAAKKY